MAYVAFQYLVDRPDLIPEIEKWFINEWPDYYGPDGPGVALDDLEEYCQKGNLPLGMVAFENDIPCGFMALKSEPFPSHPDLSPWLGAAYTRPDLRRKGIGSRLMEKMEAVAADLKYKEIYCATSTSASLLQRREWKLLERVDHQGQVVEIYGKAL